MVDVVTIFIFLGALIIRDGLCDKEIRRGIAMGKDSSSSSRSHLVVWVAVTDTVDLLQQVMSWTSSFVVPMALMSRLTQSIHTVSVFFAFFSRVLPSPESVFLRSICLAFYVRCQTMHLRRAFMHLSVMLSIFSLSFMFSFLSKVSQRVAARPTAHLHFCHFQFIHVGSSHRYCLHPVQHSWMNDHLVIRSFNMWWYSLIAYIGSLTSSNRCSIPTVSSCLFL